VTKVYINILYRMYRFSSIRLWNYGICSCGSGLPCVHCGAGTVTEEVEWEPTRWWRVLDANGDMWCETSDEDEARDAMFYPLCDDPEHEDNDECWEPDKTRPRVGFKLQRMYQTTPVREWKDET
jgi:hypothetical protein